MKQIILCTCGDSLSNKFDFPALKTELSSWADVSKVELVKNFCKEVPSSLTGKYLICACSYNLLEPLLKDYPVIPDFFDLRAFACQDVDPEIFKTALFSVIKARLTKLDNQSEIEHITIPLDEKPIVIVGHGLLALRAIENLRNTISNPIHVFNNSDVFQDSVFVKLAANYEEYHELYESLKNSLKSVENVHFHTINELNISGEVGSFNITYSNGNSLPQILEAGTILLTGDYEEYQPKEYAGSGVVTWSQVRDKGILENESDVLIATCVGSRTKERPYCSSYCCQTAVSEALHLAEENKNVTVLYKEIRTLGTDEQTYVEARKKGVRFIRGGITTIEHNSAGQPTIFVEDTLSSTKQQLEIDKVILSSALLPPSFSVDVAKQLGIPMYSTGYLRPLYSKLRTELTQIPGIFITDSLVTPQTPQEALDSVDATSFDILRAVTQGYKKFRQISVVDQEKCITCENCIKICPAAAAYLKDDKASVNSLACIGCGLCATACPTQAITLMNDNSRTIEQQIEILAKEFRKGAPEEPLVFTISCKECALSSVEIAAETDWTTPLTLPIIVPCAGAISILEILKAFEAGADGLVIAACAHCHNGQGHEYAEAHAQLTSDLFEAYGKNPNEIGLIKTCAAEPNKYVDAVNEVYQAIRGKKG
ncbi:MAG: hydrogenase iron-sulfur subunit [Candidatus Hermodarchaeota archaeon]